MLKELVGCVVVVAFCLGVTWAAGYEPIGMQAGGAYGPVIVYAAAVAVVIQWVVFVPSYLANNEKFFDLTGSLTYILVTCATLAYRLATSSAALALQIRPIVSSALVVIWALRLGSFLVRRIFKAGKDARFDELKSFGVFLFTWTVQVRRACSQSPVRAPGLTAGPPPPARPLSGRPAGNGQGLWVTLTTLAVLIMNTTTLDKALQVNDYVGWSVWAVGFAIEVIADEQKKAFANRKTGKWIEEGLWRYSRHPNYFGEIVLWTGQFIVGTSIYMEGQWVAILSPLFIIFLLTRLSGIPMTEKRADEKFGADPEYLQYKKTVSVLIPWFRTPPRNDDYQRANDAPAAA